MNIRTSALMVSLLALTGLSHAQQASSDAVAAPPPTSGAAGTESIVLAHPAQAAAPKVTETRERTVSPNVAALLADGMPTYNPPPPAKPVEDLRETDKPKNTIIRLPQFLVREKRPEVFTEKQMTTKEGRADLAMNAHPGLNLGNAFGLNEPIAAQMVSDQDRLDNISDLTDTARAIDRGGDAAEGLYILRETQETYMRNEDLPAWRGPGAGDGRP